MSSPHGTGTSFDEIISSTSRSLNMWRKARPKVVLGVETYSNDNPLLAIEK